MLPIPDVQSYVAPLDVQSCAADAVLISDQHIVTFFRLTIIIHKSGWQSREFVLLIGQCPQLVLSIGALDYPLVL